MKDKKVLQKIDSIVRIIFTLIMIFNFIIQVLVLLDLISLANYSFQTVVMFIYQVIVFIIFLFYYLLSLIVNIIFKIKIRIKVLVGSFLINFVLLLLTFAFLYI